VYVVTKGEVPLRSLIIGMGEVGTALHEVIKDRHETWTKDQGDYVGPRGKESDDPTDIEIIHICLNFKPEDPDWWMGVVAKYALNIKPKIINVQTTVPPGTTALLQKLVNIPCVHSTTRGLHPNLTESIRTFDKHVGGPESDAVAKYFHLCGLDIIIHATAKTTELAHILQNTAYGVQLMFADEMDKLCREYGVDYHEAVTIYTATGNQGYHDLGHSSKIRMNLTPPRGKIGGHCIVYGANLIPSERRGKMMEQLAKYNDERVPCDGPNCLACEDDNCPCDQPGIG